VPRKKWFKPLLVLLAIIVLALLITALISGPLGTGLFGNLGLNWLKGTQPKIEISAKEVFNILGWPITNSMIAAWLTIIVLVVLGYFATHRMKPVPSGLQAVFEFVFGWLLSFCQSVAGEKNGRRFMPLVATIFLFIIMNGWLSLIPGFNSITVTRSGGDTVSLLRDANVDINFTLALAIVSFIAVEYFTFQTLGISRYLRDFLNASKFIEGLRKFFQGDFKSAFSGLVMGIVDIFIGILEFMSKIVRIASFTFRLFGNMLAGEILLLITIFLIPWIFSLPFYGLELLVGFIQALVFGSLTLVFLTIAVSGQKDGEESKESL
jgi:F-type H+-transporting ATPase subunit a